MLLGGHRTRSNNFLELMIFLMTEIGAAGGEEIGCHVREAGH